MWLYVFYSHTLITLRGLLIPFVSSIPNQPCSLLQQTYSVFLSQKNPNPQIPVSPKIQHAIYSKRNDGDDATTLRPHCP
ncbi:hypothetical protein HanRHA438_Chr14g0663661 [Helianthus annuus]|uniref:Uncharacterized protein n=1 Tax=Helianthus annuus TaxID=4232 RepID=A0A251SJL3_HELAN|nr:hypothetical protein HanXRQr2_Chr14g0653061 [Helianthus annuus]KAJ0464805.1 hypothetical protein HanHA300_Chr14g0531401 [Helianthus annuus]KAJ0486403.1 hypothetical protein HanHA89_Chr14g0579281 [Helianthus annuus]KAJ0656956.1 hypothetical protein HanLR1_Chr14g0541711 [Helianthus annuus]KAJ0854534.1 hypothetical protein HanRHA438_Chr14g0663661 [Helianthus annuus]